MANLAQLPKGVTLEQLRSNWEAAQTAYATAFRRLKLLDACDRGRLWDALRASFPKYQLLPDTNHVSYVKNNLVASLYTVGKSAQILPTTQEDKETVFNVNLFLEHFWDLSEVGMVQLRAGDRAALTNYCPVWVGYDEQKDQPDYKVIAPDKFMRDPYSPNLDYAAYCMTWEVLHKNVIAQDKRYKDTLESATAALKTSTTSAPVELHTDRPTQAEAQGKSDYYKLIIHWVRLANGDIAEIHTLDNVGLLYAKPAVKPAMFPIAELYCNDPAGDLIGTSECAKIYANSVAYNITNSLLLTAEYKNQRPPKFVNSGSGLNLSSFIKHGNDADYTFVVSGDASKAVHYHQFPLPSQNAGVVMNMLGRDIQQVSGVDSRYTGRDTGSILTTGGIESMLDQVTQIDMPKVLNYEAFTKRLTQLTLANLIEFAPKRSYFIKNPKTQREQVIEIAFSKLDQKALSHYSLHISSELPKNKSRLAQTANILMEKQMQYAQAGGKVDFLTPEEWLLLQDLPIKELIQERMGIQRNQDYLKQVTQTLFQYAALTSNGVPPEDALQLTADQLQMDNQPGMAPPGLMPEPEQTFDSSAPQPLQ